MEGSYGANALGGPFPSTDEGSIQCVCVCRIARAFWPCILVGAFIVCVQGGTCMPAMHPHWCIHCVCVCRMVCVSWLGQGGHSLCLHSLCVCLQDGMCVLAGTGWTFIVCAFIVCVPAGWYVCPGWDRVDMYPRAESRPSLVHDVSAPCVCLSAQLPMGVCARVVPRSLSISMQGVQSVCSCVQLCALHVCRRLYAYKCSCTHMGRQAGSDCLKAFALDFQSVPCANSVVPCVVPCANCVVRCASSVATADVHCAGPARELHALNMPHHVLAWEHKMLNSFRYAKELPKQGSYKGCLPALGKPTSAGHMHVA